MSRRAFGPRRRSRSHLARKRECVCGRSITAGGPWTQHVRRCPAAQEVEAARAADRILRDLGVDPPER